MALSHRRELILETKTSHIKLEWCSSTPNLPRNAGVHPFYIKGLILLFFSQGLTVTFTMSRTPYSVSNPINFSGNTREKSDLILHETGSDLQFLLRPFKAES